MRFKPIAISLFLALQLGPIQDRESAFRFSAPLGTLLIFPASGDLRFQSSYLGYLEHRLKGDIVALLETTQEMMQAVQPDRTADYKQVSHAANKIRKLASRIKWGLTFGNRSADEKVLTEADSESTTSESLQDKVDELNQLVYQIVENAAGRSRHIVDAKVQCALYAQVDSLETLALQVKLEAEQLARAGE
jgi:hypothetical protein